MIDGEAAARLWIAGLGDSNGIAIDRLNRLERLLSEENLRQNLVATASLEHVWQRHFADSAQLVTLADGVSGSWLDLGSGAGFPGLIVAILQPDRQVVLIESRTKRARWLETVTNHLALDNVSVLHRDIEKLDATSTSVLSARALARLSRIVELAERFSTVETLWLLPKGRSARNELQELNGWNHTFHVEQSLTDPEAGIIVGKLLGRQIIEHAL